LIVHVAIAWLLTRTPLPTPKEPLPIRVVYPSTTEKLHVANGARRTRRSDGGKSRPLADFLPTFAMQPAGNPNEGGEPTIPDWIDTHAYDDVSLVGPSTVTMEQAKFLSSVWRMVDQEIWDTPFLSEYNHSGHVFLRFEVDDDGHFESRSMTASGLDRVLKVIAARAVRKAMKNENGDILFPHKKTIINARFSWTGYEACDQLRAIRNNFLSFCHYAENKSKSFSTGERAANTAGAIWNHGPWAVEDIKEYNREERRRNSGFDPFESLKRDPDWNL